MAGDNSWPASNVTTVALKAWVLGGLLRPIMDEETSEWIVPLVGDREPNSPAGYVVCFLAFFDRGFRIPASRFMHVLVHYYGVELHNFNPNFITQVAVFTTVCEGYLGVLPHWNLWLHLFKSDMSSRNVGGVNKPLKVRGYTLQVRQSRSHLYIRSLMPSSNRGWQNGWFYLRNDHGLLLEFTRMMVKECLEKWQ